MLYFLTWRDIKVRYKQTVLGGAWAILQPLLLMAVFSIFLGRLAGLDTDSAVRNGESVAIPYPIFVFAGLVPWSLFAQALSGASDSLVGSSSLVSKVYFPRLVLPIAAASSFILDFSISMLVLFGMMAIYGIVPTAAIIWLPAFALLGYAAALAVGIWLSAVNVKYRDVRYAVPFIIQVWLFTTPVAYRASLIPIQWRALYFVNPMAGVIEGFRWALLGTSSRPGPMILVSTIATGVALIFGLAYFRRVERGFADVI